jgi:beta-1,4-mannosyl-glycoprotein beta-1,4-N-acetylglucosaminyltransferase
MLVDCFTFYNEIDMLRFRIAELKDVVDYFVLVEADRTFNNNPKPLTFEENKHLFECYNIIHVKATVNPDGDAWSREKAQRNAIMDGLNTLSLSDDDIVIINDVDEIPNTHRLRDVKENGINEIFALEQEVFYYNFNCKFDGKWYHPKIMNYKSLVNAGSPEAARFTLCPVIQNAGWHLSYFGDTEFIINKIKSFSHQEYNNETYLNKQQIEDCIRDKKDLFLREGMNYVYNEICDCNLPKNYKMLL